jgi:hypothetical protein
MSFEEPLLQEEPAPAEEPAAEEPKKKKSKRAKAAEEAPDPASTIATPPMWRLADEDTEIILVGTFHILPPDLQWRSPELGKAIDAAEEIWFEAETDTPDAQKDAMRIIEAQGLLKKGVTLSSMIEQEDAQKLGEIIESLNDPDLAEIERMRPWYAFLALSVKFIESKGFEPGAGLESRLIAEGRARGRDFVFLETMRQQLAFFSKLTPESERSLLVLTIRDWEQETAEFDTLFAAWKAGDADAIDALMNAAMRDTAPEVYETLVKKRNEAWAGRIKSALDSPGRKLIAVGAAHLVGADGVPALLEAEGLSVPRHGLAANDNDPPIEKKKAKRRKKG